MKTTHLAENSRTSKPKSRGALQKQSILRGSISLLLVSAASLLTATTGRATLLYWDLNGATANTAVAATGTWDGTNAFWNTVASGTGGVPQAGTTDADDLFFSSGTTYTTGTITLAGARVASSISFNQNIALTLSGGTSLTIGGTGVNSGIFVLSGANAANIVSTPVILNSTSSAVTLSNAGTGLLTVGAITGSAAAGTQTVTVTSTATGGVTLNGIIGNGGAGGNVGLVVNSTGSGVTTLTGANTFTGGLTIKSGTVTGTTSAAAFGNGTITLGDTTGSANSRLNASAATYSNAIVVAGGNTGTATISTNSAAPTFSGGITLNSHDLTFQNSGFSIVASGGVTGTGNLILNSNQAGIITLSTNAINNVGTISTVGVNTANGGTATLISAPVGANVTQINHGQKTDGAFTVTPLSVSGAVTVGATNKLFRSTGTSLFTISGAVTGTGAVTFNANSTGGITLSTGGINNVGTVTNSGSGAGLVTISGVIGGSVTGLLNTSGTMRISGLTNTFAGDVTVSGGVLEVAGGTFTTTNPLGTKASVYKQVFLTNNATFRLITTSYNVNVPTATNVGAGQVFNIGAGGGTFDISSGLTMTLDDGTGAGTAWTNTQLQGSGTLTKTGLGILSLGNAATSNAVFTGQILVNQGILRLGPSSATGVALGSTSANTVIASGAAFDINNNAGTFAEPVTINGTGVTGQVIFNSNAAAGSFSGPITLGSSSTIGSTTAGQLTFTAGSSFALGSNTLTISNAGTGRIFTDGVISGAGNVVMNSSNTGDWVPRVGHTYSGGTTLTAGLVAVDIDSAGAPGSPTSGAFGTGLLTIVGAQMRSSTTASRTVGNTVTISGDPTFFTAATEKTLVFSGPVTLSGGTRTLTSTVGNTVAGTTVLLNGAIGDGGGTLGLTKAGTGSITLAGVNTYTGTTTVNAGTLNLTGSLAASTAVTVAGGATLSLYSGVANPLGTISALNLGGGAGTTMISLDLGANTAASDFLSSANAAVTSNNVAFAINAIAGFGTAGTYDLVSAASGLSGATYALASAPGGFGYAFNNTDSLVQLVLSANAAGDYYWRGAVNNSWAAFNAGNTNWSTNLAGTVNALSNPGAANSVIFSSTAATGPVFATTLDGSFTVRDLQFTSNPAGVTTVTVAPGALTPGALTLSPSSASAGIAVAADAGAVTISAPVALGASQTWSVDGTGANGSALTVSGAISGAGSETLAITGGGTGIVTLSAAAGLNTYSGPTTVSNGGILRGGATNSFSQNSAMTVTGNGILRLNGLGNTVPSLAGNGTVQNGHATTAATLIVGDATTTADFSGTLQNGAAAALGLTKQGTGTQTLSGANTYTGATTINAGTLKAGSSTAFNGTSVLTLAGTAALDLGGFTATFPNIAASPATTTITNNGAVTGTLAISNLTTAIGALIQDGSQPTAVTMINPNSGLNAFTNSNNTFSGGLTLLDGSALGNGTRLRIGSAIVTGGSPGAITNGLYGTGAITIGLTPTDKAGVLLDTVAGISLLNAVVFNTALGTDVAGFRVDTLNNLLSGTITANLASATFTAGGGSTSGAILTGKVTGPAGLAVSGVTSGSLTVTLNNAAMDNDYLGDTSTLSASNRLDLGAADQIPNGAGKGNVINNGFFRLNGFSETINGLSGSGTVDGMSGSPTLTVGDGNATGNTFNGVIRNTGGALSLTKIGSGTQTLGGANTFSGVVSANGGRLAFATSANLGNESGTNTITLDGGALVYTGAGAVDLTVNRVVEIGAAGGTLEASGSTGALTVSGGISIGSTGNLTKAGPGTVILPAGTGWNGGANSVTVSDGTLRAGFGIGGIGKLTVGATGDMDFRDSATETLTLGAGAGAITLTGGARLGFDLDSSANDQLFVPVGGTAVTGGTVTLNFFNFGGGVAATTYNLLSAPSGLSGATYALGTAPLGFNYTINVTDMLVSLTTVAYTPRYWTGLLDTSWSTIAGPASNWSTDSVGTTDAGAVPGAAHTIIFSASSPAQPAALTTTLDGAVAVDSLQFISQPGNVTSVTVNPGAGGTLAVTPASTSGGIYVGPDGGVATLAAPLTLGAGQTWNVDGTGANGSALVISGNTAFGGAVNKTGDGAVTLSGNNTGSAAFTLSAGRLNIDTNTALPTGTFTIGAGTTIDSGTGATLTANNVQNWNGSFTYAGTQALNLGTGAVTMGASATVTTTANTLTVGGAIGDGGNNRNLTKAGAGTLILNGNNTYGGLTTVSGGVLTLNGTNASAAGVTVSGGTLNIGNIGALGSGTLTITGGAIDNTTGGAATISNAQAWNGSFTFAGSNNLTLSAATIPFGLTPTITVSASTLIIPGNIGGSFGLTKAGQGALTLGGTNTYQGNTTVSGTLNVTGTLTGTGTAGTGQILAFGGSAGNNVVNVSNDITDYYTFTGANNAGAVSVYNQTAGTVNFTSTATANATNLLATNGYGYMNITGGSLVAKGRFTPSNGANGTGVIYLGTGGTLDHTGGEWFLMSYAPSGSGGLSQITVASGGSLLRAGASSNFGLNMDRTNGYAVLNVAGGLVTTSTRTITFGNGTSAATNTTGMINLAAGTLTFGVAMTNGNTAGSGNNAFLNFAGGTLQPNAAVTNVIPATAANQTFTSTIFGAIDNSALAGAPSFLGGLTVDTNGFATSFSNAFLAAAGSGVSQADIVIPGGGNSGYIGAPAVQFSNAGVVAGGTPASGYAVISGGLVTGIVITNPGTYTAGSTPTVTLTGGGGSISAFSTSALNTSNTAGGLTKVGGGTLTLSGASTYAGATLITAGTLQLGAAGATGALSPNSAIVNDGVFAINRTNAAVQGTDFSSSPITGTGSFVQAGAGSVQFTAANSYDGTTTISAGTLIVGDGAAAGTIGDGAVSLAGALVFNRTDTYTLLATNLVTGAGAVTLNSGTVAAAVSNQFNVSGALTFGSAAQSPTVAGLDLTAGGSTFGGTALVRTNSATANTIIVGGGTLSIGGLTMGTSNAPGISTQSNLTISGGGSFAITGGSVQVGVSQGTINSTNNDFATLDLSGLTGANAFTANVTNFNVGQGNTSQGTVILSDTANGITATTLNVGHSNGNNGIAQSFLTLGAGTNVIQADTINIGLSKIGGTVSFLSQAPASPGSVTITNTAGTGPASITIGSNNGTGTGAVFTGFLDLRGHTSTVSAGTLSLGIGNNTATGSVTGSLSFDSGTFTANSITLGSKSGAAGTGTATGVLNVGGGSFTVNSGGSFVMATNTAATGAGVGTVNITGGTFTSNVDITRGGGTNTTATLTLDGGTLDMSGFNIGGAVAISTLNFRSGTLRNVAQINNGASVLTKTTAGSATISGANGYTGGTAVNDGVLILDGLNTGTGVIRGIVDVNPGATLQLASANALGYSSGLRVTTVNINGGIMESVVNGDQGFNQIYNLTGGIMQSNSGVSSAAAPQWFAFGSGFGGSTAVNSLASGTSSTIAGRVIFRNDNLNTNINFTVADGAAATDLLVSAAITQNAGLAVGLTKAGAGLMALTGANSYAGVTTVSNGILSIDASANLGDASATNTIAINGGTLRDTGAGVNLGTNRSVAVGASGATIEVTTGGDLNVSGAISGTGNTLTKTGNGVLKITGAQTYGTLTTSAGTTDVYTAVGTGTSTVNANATTNFSTSQTLAALNIGAGAVVTFGALPPPFVGDGEKFAAGVVPEPGSIGLLMVGALGILSRRRRPATPAR